MLTRAALSGPRFYNAGVAKTFAVALTTGACVWIALVVAVPYAMSSGHPALTAAAALFYQAAGLICHQRPERSFHLSGSQLPVCGRCFGLYLSAAFGTLAAWVTSAKRVPPRSRVALAFAAIPTALSVSLELAGLIYPTNVARALSALPLGATAAWIFVRSLRAEANRSA